MVTHRGSCLVAVTVLSDVCPRGRCEPQAEYVFAVVTLKDDALIGI